MFVLGALGPVLRGLARPCQFSSCKLFQDKKERKGLCCCGATTFYTLANCQNRQPLVRLAILLSTHSFPKRAFIHVRDSSCHSIRWYRIQALAAFPQPL